MHLAALGAEPGRRFVFCRTDQRNRPPVLEKKSLSVQLGWSNLVEAFAEKQSHTPQQTWKSLSSKSTLTSLCSRL